MEVRKRQKFLTYTQHDFFKKDILISYLLVLVRISGSECIFFFPRQCCCNAVLCVGVCAGAPAFSSFHPCSAWSSKVCNTSRKKYPSVDTVANIKEGEVLRETTNVLNKTSKGKATARGQVTAYAAKWKRKRAAAGRRGRTQMIHSAQPRKKNVSWTTWSERSRRIRNC